MSPSISSRPRASGGYAPAYPERGLAEPELQAVQAALKQVLAGHEPYPAVVVNRWWELVEANSGIAIFTNHTVEELAIESFYPADDHDGRWAL